MEKENFKFLKGEDMKELVYNGVISWEYILKSKKLADSTVNRKIKDIGMFYEFLVKQRDKKNIHIKGSNITDITFEYVRDGLFSIDNLENEGTCGYRRAIYHNIQEGFNYIYDKYFENKIKIIDDLTEDRKEMLDDVSRNKFFKNGNLESKNENNKDTIQTKLIKELGLKVSFDENNKPYVLSNETAELLGKENSNIMTSVREILKEFNALEFKSVAQTTDFTMINDFYIDSKGENRPNMKLYKDLAIKYILGLTPRKKDKNYQNIIEFQYKYIDAFNYIEEEHNKLLEKYANLKDSFLTMYNLMRLRNRELLVIDHNKKAKAKQSKKKVS